MISLNHDRARLTFLTVKRSACYARDWTVRNNFNSIMYHRYMSPNQCNFVSLPFSWIFSCINRWCNKSVNATDTYLISSSLRIFNLEFITATKINSAITSFRIPEFYAEFKIIKFLIGNQVATFFLVHHYTIYHFKFIILRNNPTIHIVGKQINRITPHRRNFSF